MSITYDELWATFLSNYKVNDADLPNTDEAIYSDIKNAVRFYNNRMRTKLTLDNDYEVINGAESDDEVLIIAHYLRLVFLINEKTLYESLYQPISPDVGIRNYNTQVNSLENSISRQEEYIEKFILNTREDFL